MKVENGNILLDDEIVDLDNVAMIDVAQVGSHFDEPKFALSVVYRDATSRTVAITVDNNKSKVFRQLNKLGKQIINEGNDNFADIGLALINLDYINHVEWEVEDGKINVLSYNKHINSFRATSIQAKRILAKLKVAYDKYNQSRVQQL